MSGDGKTLAGVLETLARLRTNGALQAFISDKKHGAWPGENVEWIPQAIAVAGRGRIRDALGRLYFDGLAMLVHDRIEHIGVWKHS